MMKRVAVMLVMVTLFGSGTVLAKEGLVRLSMPDEDPGPPFYARVGYQILESDGWVAIPFYRAPECVPATFNLLEFFHFPGPGGPGAFACPLLMSGHILIEPDAPLGTFPKQSVFTATAVPIWFVPSPVFHTATADGVLTLSELESLQPRRGVANRYHETLNPREGEHRIVISANGTLEQGGAFSFHVTHLGDAIVTMNIRFR